MDDTTKAVSARDFGPIPWRADRRFDDFCASCRCKVLGGRVCRRGESDSDHVRPTTPLSDSGLMAVPLILDPPNRVREALDHYAASLKRSGSSATNAHSIHMLLARRTGK